MKYCAYCGNAFTEAARASADTPTCSSCGKTPTRPGPEDTVVFCPHCKRESTLDAQYCSWCGEEVQSAFQAAVAQGVLQPSPFKPRWQISNWYGEGAGKTAPFCPKCGKRISPDGSQDVPHMGYANPPWNASWDGSCQHCGFRFELASEQALHINFKRYFRVRPSNKFIQTFIDEAIVLSGIEVTISEDEVGGPSEGTTLFISMAELAQMMEALRKDLSVYFEQYDWSQDWT
jgi:hypothetical protein